MMFEGMQIMKENEIDSKTVRKRLDVEIVLFLIILIQTRIREAGSLLNNFEVNPICSNTPYKMNNNYIFTIISSILPNIYN